MFYIYFFGRTVWILVSRLGIEPAPPALEVRSLSHWTSREIPREQILKRRGMWAKSLDTGPWAPWTAWWGLHEGSRM